MTMREQLTKIREENPTISDYEVGKIIGTTTRVASNLLTQFGLSRIKKPILKRPRTHGLANPVSAGACGELLICADLIPRGLDVFRSVSPSAKCDLVAIHRAAPFKSIRIEVRNGYRNPNGNLVYSKARTTDGSCDVIAVWVKDEGAIYLPDETALDQ